MKEGYFFRLDEHSLPHEGQVLFRYLPVKRRNSPKNENTNKQNGKTNQYNTEHPVYAVLKPYAIEFYYNGTDAATGDSIHILLLDLPLQTSYSVSDQLRVQLKSRYNKAFRLGKTFQSDLGLSTPGKEMTLAYWNLPVFYKNNSLTYLEILRKQFREELEEELKVLKKCPDLETKAEEIVLEGYIFYRKLILDFVYDLEHSRIFENSQYFQEIKAKLSENLFFQAITVKAAYFFSRSAYLRIQELTELESKHRFHAQQLSDAEIAWINFLKAQQTPELFRYAEENWFEDVEEEFKIVLFGSISNEGNFDRRAWRNRLEKLGQNTLDIRILRESARWFLHRYSFINATRAVFQQGSKWKMLGFAILFILPFFVVLQILVHFDSLWLYSSGKAGVILFFIIVFISLILVLRRYLDYILDLLMPRLMMAIASIWLLFTTTEELWKVSFDTTLEYELGLLIILLGIAVVFMTRELKRLVGPSFHVNLGKKKYTVPTISRVFPIIIIGYIYSLVIGLLLTDFTARKMLCRSGYLENYYKELLHKTENYRVTEKVTDVLLANGFQPEAIAKLDSAIGKTKFSSKQQFLAAIENTELSIPDSLQPVISEHAFQHDLGDLSPYVFACCLGVTEGKHWLFSRFKRDTTTALIRRLYAENEFTRDLDQDMQIKLAYFHFYNTAQNVELISSSSENFHLITNPTPDHLFDGLEQVTQGFLGIFQIKNMYKVPILEIQRNSDEGNNREITFTAFPAMLLMLATFALIIGILVQLIFEEKSITEPI